MKIPFRKLKKNDWIICPSDGRREQVTRSNRYAAGRWFVRTNHHDHIRPAQDLVELAEGGS